MAEAYIVATARTAGGRKGGRLAGWHPADLAATVLDSLVERTGADPALVEDVIMGCVSQVGEQAGNVARNAILASRLPESVPGTSVDRQCGSSQQALHFAAQAVMSGAMDIVIAAGVESMTRVPMGLSSQLPAKNGFGVPKSPGVEARYPGVQFSQFTGAARELTDALQFNPFAIGEIMCAIHTALSMAPEERQRRMRRMRAAVEANNVYRWAGKLLQALLRIDVAEQPADTFALIAAEVA